MRRNIYSIFNVGFCEKFDKYLGFPIFHAKPNNRDYQFILHNLKKKLAGWKTRFMNIAGRTTLAKAYLNSIPTHIMQYNRLTGVIEKSIDKIQRNFIWGTTDVKKKLHEVRWDTLVRPKEVGGLGL